MRSRLADVAREAGVSVASASRVLNGHSAHPETAERIRQAAVALGYQPDLSARSLKLRRTGQLSLAVDDLGNPAYVAMMRGVERVARAAGYRLQVSAIGSDPDFGAQTALHTVSRGYTDGLIICPLRTGATMLDVLLTAPIPVVVIGTLPRGTRLDNVTVDSGEGVRLAMDHLVATGRRRIAFLGGPADTNPGARRLDGYRRAQGDLGLDGSADRCVLADGFTYDAGTRAMSGLVARGDFDGLLAANDVMAIAAMHCLLRAGVTVPDDVAVVGIDDTEVTEYSNPTLTSVSLGAEQRGAAAARLLLRRLADPAVPVRRVRQAVQLRLRDSTGPMTAAAKVSA